MSHRIELVRQSHDWYPQLALNEVLDSGQLFVDRHLCELRVGQSDLPDRVECSIGVDDRVAPPEHLLVVGDTRVGGVAFLSASLASAVDLAPLLQPLQF